jgi:hypothetical protein
MKLKEVGWKIVLRRRPSLGLAKYGLASTTTSPTSR